MRTINVRITEDSRGTTGELVGFCSDMAIVLTDNGKFVKVEPTKMEKIDRDIEQKPAKWSEEDEQYLLVCKNALAKYKKTDKWDAHIIFHWLENKLKSLRPQNTWKPSDKQIEAVRIAAEIGTANDSWAMHVLEELYTELKKLKG